MVLQRMWLSKTKGSDEMKVKLDNGAFLPTRAYEDDAGLDLYAPNGYFVPARGSAVINTGVHAEIPHGYVGMLKSKSGLNVWNSITSEGVIDCGYTGSICVKLYNHSDEDFYVAKGQKVSQLVILPIITPDIEIVDELSDTERGSNGFGSTGA